MDADRESARGDLADREWRLVREERRPGPVTMALEEVAARTVAGGGPCTVRVYTWPDVLSLGYRQDPDTIDREFCRDRGINVVRRQTGGGGIYHDSTGDLSYAVVAPREALPGSPTAGYELLCRPLFDALDRVGVDAGFADREQPALYEPSCYLRSISPAHDVVADGRKLSGNAQYRRREAVVQHGSLSVAPTVERHLGAFGDPVSPAAFQDRVGAVSQSTDVDRSTVVTALEESLAEFVDATAGDWTDEELAAARELAERKYATDAWTRERTDPTRDR